MFHRPIPFDDAIKAPIAAAHRQAHLRITDQLMTIGLPQGVRLHLGDDLSAEFPPALRQIANPNLITLLAQIDPTLDSTRDSGAIDWAELPDRIHFIADMFRCYADTADLFEPPFTPEQVTRLKAGRLPDGQL